MNIWPPAEPDPGSQPTWPPRQSEPREWAGTAWWRRAPLVTGTLVVLLALLGTLFGMLHAFGPLGHVSANATATGMSGHLASAPVTAAATARATATPTRGTRPTAATGPSAGLPTYAHVYLIMMENTWYGSIVGNSQAPYLNGALIPNGALATNYFALTHPSAPNYWALTSGQIMQDSNCPLPPKDPTTPNCMWSVTTLGEELSSAGMPWRAYYEDMPQDCYADHNAPTNWTYTPNYNPWINYTDVNPSGCAAHDVPMPTSPSALAGAVTAQTFAMISPNLCHDMHNCPISTGDAWLQQNVPAIQQSPACTRQSCLIVISWDEDDSAHNNQVAAIMWGSAHVTAGRKDGTHYNHYALLHTIEEVLGLRTLTNNDRLAPAMSGMFSWGT